MFRSPSYFRNKKGVDGLDMAPSVQACFDVNAGGVVELEQMYACAHPVRPHAGTTIIARNGGGLEAHPALDQTARSEGRDPTLIENPAYMFTGDDRPDSGVKFHGVTLRGNDDLRENPGAAMVVMIGCADWLFDHCNMSHWHHVFTPRNCRRITWDDCDVSMWGSTRFLPERESDEGKAIIAANPGVPVESLRLRGNCQDDGGYGILGGGADNDQFDVLNSRFHDGMWTPIDALGPNNAEWRIINTHISRVYECGIYLGVRAIIDRCSIIDVKRRDCSAHCIEGSGPGTRITRSTFGRPDAAWLFPANPIDMYVGHCTMFDAMMQGNGDDGAIGPFWSAQMFVRNMGPVEDALRGNGLLVEHIDAISTNGRASHFMSLYDNGAGPIDNVVVRKINAVGKYRAPLVMTEGNVRGAGWSIEGEATPIA